MGIEDAKNPEPIEAQLENTKDPDTQPSNLPAAPCNATTGYNYRVINP